MGNLFTHNKSDNNVYEPFVNKSNNSINLSEQIQQLIKKNDFLEEELRILKRDFELQTSRIDSSIQTKYSELSNSVLYYYEKNNEKINIITKDMENLLNNDKILLDKLIEKNIVSTIQEEEYNNLS